MKRGRGRSQPPLREEGEDREVAKPREGSIRPSPQWLTGIPFARPGPRCLPRYPREVPVPQGGWLRVPSRCPALGCPVVEQPKG